jgi:protein phosphatase
MLEIDAAVATHVGNVRSRNEDWVSFVRPSEAEAQASRGVLAIVADGMGGHKAGEHASRLAAETIARSYFDSSEELRGALVDAFREANCAVYGAAMAQPAWKGMGTTCVAVAICKDQAWWAWVGDSRLYLLRGGSIYRLTEDHTVVQDMVRRGWMTTQEANAHRDRNVLERAIGTREAVEPGVGQAALRLEPGDRLLLCSDGLHDLLTDEEMASFACEVAARDGAERMIEMALRRGAPDNLSVVLLEAKAEAAARPPTKTREHVLA